MLKHTKKYNNNSKKTRTYIYKKTYKQNFTKYQKISKIQKNKSTQKNIWYKYKRYQQIPLKKNAK